MGPTMLPVAVHRIVLGLATGFDMMTDPQSFMTNGLVRLAVVVVVADLLYWVIKGCARLFRRKVQNKRTLKTLSPAEA